MQEGLKVHLAVLVVKVNVGKEANDLEQPKDKEVKDSEKELKGNVVNQHKDLDQPQDKVINKVLVKHLQIKTLHHYLLAVIS